MTTQTQNHETLAPERFENALPEIDLPIDEAPDVAQPETGDPIAITVEDMTGSVSRRVAGIPLDATIDDLIASLAFELDMPDTDVQGRPILYGLRTAEGNPLNPTDIVRDFVKQDDTLTITKSVTAG